LVALLLGCAVYVGTGLLNDQVSAGADADAIEIGDELIAATGSRVEVLPAPEMPASSPDVSGVFVRREDARLVLGTGAVTFRIDGDATFDGPAVEVVPRHDTEIYRDDTAAQLGGVPPTGSVHQALRPGSIDEIDRNDVVSAWGERHGDRLIATVIVYAAQ
jgi:hypothetical protein